MSENARAPDGDQAQMVGERAEIKYPLTEERRARIVRDFTYHAPKKDQRGRYEALRNSAQQLAAQICMTTPPSDEQGRALEYLTAAIFYANAAIARNE